MPYPEPNAYTIGRIRVYDRGLADGISKAPGGWAWRTVEEAQRFIDEHDGQDFGDFKLTKHGFAVYGLLLPTGWVEDVTKEPDPAEGVHLLMARSPIVGLGIHELRAFCPGCFADDHGGSWGEVVVADADWCANCGAGGVVQIPAWAVKSIREQASWVGKRYYPHEEDRQTSAEVFYLRSQMPLPPGRTAKMLEPAEPKQTYGVGPNRWWVTQEYAGRGNIMITVGAGSAEEALKRSVPLLPYPVPT